MLEGDYGKKVFYQWHQRIGPGPLLDRLRNRKVIRGAPQYPGWVDHRYRIKLSTGGWCWVAEPYGLNEEDMGDLAYLQENGFDINVSATQALHFPGRTVAVHIYLQGTERMVNVYKELGIQGRSA